MKPVLPAPPNRPSVDRVRMIRRSIRCFVFGAVGAVPLFGLGTAFLALRLQRELARESGVPARAPWMDGSSVIAFALMLFFASTTIARAINHLCRGRCESLKIVPDVAENCCLQVDSKH